MRYIRMGCSGKRYEALHWGGVFTNLVKNRYMHNRLEGVFLKTNVVVGYKPALRFVTKEWESKIAKYRDVLYG